MLFGKCDEILKTLCVSIGERPVGSEGNRRATAFVNDQFRLSGWKTETPEFFALDWVDGGASLMCGDTSFSALVSPFSKGFKGEADLVCASSISELENLKTHGKIILLYGALASEQLMPKNFVFYNPESHQRILSALEKSGARAIVCATSRNPSLAGGVYPFPLIEDGDFNIPSVYMTEEEGIRLKSFAGRKVILESRSERIPATGCNVIARKGREDGKRIVITAHIDSKKGTPGAIDNASGVTVLIMLAELLKDYEGDRQIEIVALNGEDNYAVPGQMNYIDANHGRFGSILLNINIDGAGFMEGPSSFSLFDLPEEFRSVVTEVISISENIVEGAQWPQGDHSIFLQYGVPAIAVSSFWFVQNIDNQDITHTTKDNVGIVNNERLVELSLALGLLVKKI